MKAMDVGNVGGKIVEGAFPAPDATMVNAVALTGAGAAKSVTIPSGAKYAVMSATLPFYANYSTTATVPGDTTDGTGSELINLYAIRLLDSTDIISVICAVTTVVTVTFYK